MLHHSSVRALCVVVALSACSSKKDEGTPASGAAKPTSAAPAAASPEQELYIREGKRELERLTKGLADGTADKFACAAATANLDKIEPLDKDTATRIRTLCARDIPLAILDKQVAKAEEARKAAPDKLSLPECSVDIDMAIDALDKAGTHDDSSRALVARADAACPLNAKARAGRAASKAK